MLPPITLFIEITCLILAMTYLGKKYSGWYWYFVPFMFFIIAAEASGFVMAFFFRQNNHWIYNIEMLGEIFFIPWMFYRLFAETGSNRRSHVLIGFIIMVSAFIIETMKHKWIVYNTTTYMIMSAIFIIYACLYFYGTLTRPEPVDAKGTAGTWIVAGIFIFYFAGTAVNVFFVEIMQLNLTKGIPLRYIIFMVLNAILYGCWSYAFRCLHLQTISLSR